MPNEILTRVGSPNQIVLRDSTDFSPSAANDLRVGTATNVQLDLGAVAAGGGARHSAKFDFGVDRAPLYHAMACLEFTTAPTDAEDWVELYFAGSNSSTAANANPGTFTGSDAAWTTTTGQKNHIQTAGGAPLRAATLQIVDLGVFSPRTRYGSIGFVNWADYAIVTVVDEVHIVLTPVTDEVQ